MACNRTTMENKPKCKAPRPNLFTSGIAIVPPRLNEQHQTYQTYMHSIQFWSSPSRIPAPVIAPKHWLMMYKTALAMVIFLATSIPQVTAGLMCPPLMCPMLHTIVVTIKPNAKAMSRNFGDSTSCQCSPRHVPHPTRTNNQVPRYLATTAFQNMAFLRSSKLPCISSIWINQGILLFF